MGRPKGSKLTEEHKTRIGESHKGRKKSEEHKRKISESLKGRYRGPNSPVWKGDKATATPIHDYIKRVKPKPEFCEICGVNEPRDLANKDHKYNRLNIDDYQWLCPKCHSRYDYNKFGLRKEFYEKGDKKNGN